MSDLRATERLLEVIGEQITMADADFVTPPDWVGSISDAITELRRRGDTLVRADDLRVVVTSLAEARSCLDLEGGADVEDHERADAAITRLENALGGKLA